MKLPRRLFVAWWHVHAWAGVLAGLVLAAMFLGGAFSLFRRPIEAWQDPPAVVGDRAAVDRVAHAALGERSVAGKAVGFSMPGAVSVRPVLWVPTGPLTFRPEHVDVAAGTARPAHSSVANLFFYLHFMWHDGFPLGMVIAGLFGVVLILAIATGVAIHLKDVGWQMFRFRPVGKVRAMWSDLHKVFGMWGLPFQLTMALTGSLICVLSVLGPYIGLAVFDGDRERANAELMGDAKPAAPSHLPFPALGFGALASIAEEALPEMRATYVAIEPWGDAAAIATVYGMRRGHGVWPEASVAMRARDGAVRKIDRGDHETTTHQAVHTLYGLHFGDFGGWPLRILYLVLGLAGWATIVSGNWVWIERRRQRGSGRGAEALARLTLGIGGGMLVAAAAIFWINRLAPVGPGRPAVEVWGFFAVWAATALVAALVPARRSSWAGLVALAGFGFLAVPALSAMVGPDYAGAPGATAAAVDVGLAAFGLVCLLTARLLRGRTGKAVVA